MVFKGKKLIWIFCLILFLVGVSWAAYRFFGGKNLQLISPNGKEKLVASKTYQITWKAKNIGKVGIILIKGEEKKEVKWIVKDFPAGKGKYDWEVFIWEVPGQDYKITVFEYPWQEGNKSDYSDETFSILGPQFASCDKLSVEQEWPFIPSDFPDLRKVFITKSTFSGNLEGLEGADKKCQTEAEERELEGKWKAFLGDDQNLAVDRFKLDGIFIEAEAAATVPEGKTCHRLLGRNFDDFFKKLSESLTLGQWKFSENFLKSLTDVWFGRVNKDSKRDCTTILTKYSPYNLSESYSFTVTCQNWTTDQEKVPGYPPAVGEKKEFPQCYTPQGQRINAVGLAGLASGIIEGEKGKFLAISLGKPCNFAQRLLCIQQPEEEKEE